MNGWHGDALRDIAAVVSALEPGEHATIDREWLRQVPPLVHNGARWTPEERVLENVIGSAYGWSFFIDPGSANVVFFRRDVPTGARTYVSPDRKHLFDLLPEGLYRPGEAAR